MPVAEDWLTQVGRGPSSWSASAVTSGDVLLLEQHNPALSVGGAVMHPDHVAIIVPLRWEGEYLVNGQPLAPNAVFLTSRPSGYASRGSGRVLIAATLPRDPLTRTLAALRGVGPEDVEIPDGILDLPPAAMARLRTVLPTLVSRGEAPVGTGPGARRFRDAVFGALLDQCLLVGRSAVPVPSGLCHPERIVWRAEERFAEAEWGPVSLADLCAAAGVSQSALYMAFQHLYGEPPLRFFHSRRLNRARDLLVQSESRRGAIKNAALDCGLTEFGRFSRDYRMLFGETPSATLGQN
jgi:AraC family ethanolamine operon transcriptional activator